jgi:hypothetical protein
MDFILSVAVLGLIAIALGADAAFLVGWLRRWVNR